MAVCSPPTEEAFVIVLADLLRRGFFCGVPIGVDEADEE